MADKVITLPKDAINKLLSMKREDETLTDVIMRIIGSVTNKEKLVELIEEMEPNEDLAKSIEDVYKKREDWNLRY